MEPGEEYLRCEDCGLAFSIETTVAGEHCTTCGGELIVIRAIEVRHDDEGLRLELGGDADEQDARAAVVGRRVESVQHELSREREELALFLEGGNVLVLESSVERPGVLSHRMSKAGPYRVAQAVVKLIESNPVAPDGLAYFTSGPRAPTPEPVCPVCGTNRQDYCDSDEGLDTPDCPGCLTASPPSWRVPDGRVFENYEYEDAVDVMEGDVPGVSEPAVTVDRYGGTYAMTWRALPWWHWRSLLRQLRGGGWAELAAVAKRGAPASPASSRRP